MFNYSLIYLYILIYMDYSWIPVLDPNWILFSITHFSYAIFIVQIHRLFETMTETGKIFPVMWESLHSGVKSILSRKKIPKYAIQTVWNVWDLALFTRCIHIILSQKGKRGSPPLTWAFGIYLLMNTCMLSLKERIRRRPIFRWAWAHSSTFSYPSLIHANSILLTFSMPCCPLFFSAVAAAAPMVMAVKTAWFLCHSKNVIHLYRYWKYEWLL